MSDVMYEMSAAPQSLGSSLHIEETINGFIVQVMKSGMRLSYVVENVPKRDNVAILLGIVEEAFDKKAVTGAPQ